MKQIDCRLDLLAAILVAAVFAAGCSRVRIEDFSDRSFNGPPLAKIAVEYFEPDTVSRRKAERALVSALQARLSAVELLPMCEVIFTDERISDREYAEKLSSRGFDAFLTVCMTRFDPNNGTPPMEIDLQDRDESHAEVTIDLSGQKSWFACELVELKSLRCVWRATAITHIGSGMRSFRSSIRQLGSHLAQRLAIQDHLILNRS